MNLSSIRSKLLNYIQIADIEQIKALYTLLESQINDDLPWYKNPDLLKEFNHRYENWISGEDKGVSLSEIENEIEKIKASRET